MCPDAHIPYKEGIHSVLFAHRGGRGGDRIFFGEVVEKPSMTLRVVGSALLTFVLMLAWWATSISSVAAQQKGATSKAPAAESRPWPPRTPDGQPDIQGYWGSVEGGMYSLNLESVNHLSKLGMPRTRVRDGGGSTPQEIYARGGTIVVDPPTGIIPYQRGRSSAETA